MDCRNNQCTTGYYCGCPTAAWPCDAAYLATDACYASGCGLDRSTGEVYSWENAPKAAEIVLLKRDQAFASPGSTDCRAHYDAAYDSAVYAVPASAPAIAASDAAWLNPDERAVAQSLDLFEKLLTRQSGSFVQHPFFDEQAATDYAAAEVAAAEEGAADGEQKPRFSALIYTLPQSKYVLNLEPILRALQVRAERAIEALDQGEDWIALANLWNDSVSAANAATRPQWKDYEDFLSNLPSEQPRQPIAPVATNMLLNLADAAEWLADELRRIARPYVAKSHSGEFHDAATR